MTALRRSRSNLLHLAKRRYACSSMNSSTSSTARSEGAIMVQPRPVTYRAEIIAPTLSSIAAGECCSIVGMSGVGKSNMVQHMLRLDVLHHHLGEQADTLRFVILDTNL